MLKIVTVEQTRQLESTADANGLSYAQMMENAGRATAELALNMLEGIPNPRITILIGGGNNGGDGLVAGHYLSQQAEIRFYLLKRRDDENFQRVQHLFVAHAEDDHDGRLLHQITASADLIIDALFGIGVRLPLTGIAEKILKGVNQALNARKNALPQEWIIHPSRPDKMAQIATPRVLAIDCPSGLDCDTGEIDRNTIPADATITFIAPKPGLFAFPGAHFTGELVVATIGVVDEIATKLYLATAHGVQKILPERTPSSHKGTYGKTLIMAGSQNYTGAVALAAEAAYRSGTGLVSVNTSQDVINIVASRIREATWLPDVPPENLTDYDSLLIGPGWGQAASTGKLLEALLERKLPPLIIDADGLNFLAKMDHWWEKLPDHTIITPHPGEMSRLSGLSTQEVQSNRYEIAQEKARKWGVILVLKGAHTIIAAPDGELCVLPFKTDTLATAGTGDILAGLTAGLVAQQVKPFEAAIAAGYIHGLAGELLPNGRAAIAGDVLGMIPQALTIIGNH